MQPDSDDHLVRYLLGDLTEAETERLDERSVTDPAFALRLRTLENDLVDRYARGERSAGSLERFDRSYRQSPHVREKVRFAHALQALASKSAPRPARSTATQTAGRFARRALAAAALLLLVSTCYLGMRTVRLREEVTRLDAGRASLEAQNARLQQALDGLRDGPNPPPSLATATFVLAPPRRGLDAGTSISVPKGIARVELRLRTEAEGYESFWVAVKDPVTDHTIWRGGDVTAEATGADRVVTAALPVDLLAARRYIVELSGTDRSGATELIGQYVVRVVLE